MPISPNRIATISEWKNNCGVAVIGDFMADMLRENKLPALAEKRLLEAFKNYYGIPALSNADLVKLLSHSNYFPTPNDSQEILGCMLRDFLQKNTNDVQSVADGEQLTQESLAMIAKHFKFGMQFYMVEDAAIKVMPTLAINKKARIQLPVVWHNCLDIKTAFTPVKRDYHYDRIMPDALQATLHDSQITSRFSLTAMNARPLFREDENQMKQQVREAVAEIQQARHVQRPRSAAVVPLAASTPLLNDEKSWETFVSEKIAVDIIDEQVAVDIFQKSKESFLNPARESRKIIYSLWNNKAAIVDAQTQEMLDEELAKRLHAEELASPSLR